MSQKYPVFLILYDAKKVKAYWLYVQAYFGSNNAKQPKKNAKLVTVRVPLKNELTNRTVDYMRRKKNEVLEIEVEHEE